MSEKVSTFAADFPINTVGVVQLVRAPDCGSGGRGFEPHLPPKEIYKQVERPVFLFCMRRFSINRLLMHTPHSGCLSYVKDALYHHFAICRCVVIETLLSRGFRIVKTVSVFCI